MADYVTRIRTATGDKQIDYNALANLPHIADAYSKLETLSSRTRVALGLGSSATPDDAFKALNDAVESKAGSVTPEDIGAAPVNHNHDGVYAPAVHTHTQYAPLYGYGTNDLVAGSSALATGVLYFVYEEDT